MSANIELAKDSHFPIRELSARTKVNTVTLRAWERRYGLLKPKRTAKGHRLYTGQDVETIERILTLVARGVPIGKVKALLEQPEVEDVQNSEAGDWAAAVVELRNAVEAFSVTKVDHIIHKFFSTYPAPLCSENLIQPLYKELSLINDNGAALGFAESELVRYALRRTSAKVSKSELVGKALLIASHQTPIWRLALMALELTDAKFSVQLLIRAFDIRAAITLAKKFENAYTVFYQDGLWKSSDTDLVDGPLSANTRLFLCGTAPVLANLSAQERVFKNANACVDGLIKSQAKLSQEK
jgi:DNA-binding transcriptional MerR regulator